MGFGNGSLRMRAKKSDRAIKGATAKTSRPHVRNGIKHEVKLYFRTNLGCSLFEYKVPVGPQCLGRFI